MSRNGLSRYGAHRSAVSYDSLGAAQVSQSLSSSGAHFHEVVKDSTLDNFRKDLTRSFRHAVRGEWDAVSVLRLDSDAVDEEDCGLDLPPWDPPAQGDPVWSEKHHRTLTEWVRNATVMPMTDKERKYT